MRRRAAAMPYAIPLHFSHCRRRRCRCRRRVDGRRRGERREFRRCSLSSLLSPHDILQLQLLLFAANTYIQTNRRTNERTNGRRAEMRSSSSSSHLPSLLFYVKSSNPLSLVSSKEGRTAQQPRVGGRWLVAPPRQVLNFALLNWLPCSRSVSISRGRLRSQCRRQSPLFPTNRSYIGRSLAKGRSRQGKERTGLAQLVRQNAPPIKEIRRSS